MSSGLITSADVFRPGSIVGAFANLWINICIQLALQAC